MFPQLRRHPFDVVAHFDQSVVVTYAIRKEMLVPLVPSGLEIDDYNGLGMLAIAMVKTTGLRPAFMPRVVGQDFFLAGYRIFVRHRDRLGKVRRGLKILRSYTDRRLMVTAGNLLTHYNYRLARTSFDHRGGAIHVRTTTPNHEADIDLTVDCALTDELPAGSPFESMRDARRFAGPLPFTFDLEPETNSIIMIEGRRTNWKPRPVRVVVRRNTFLEQFAVDSQVPQPANAFYVENIDYRWMRGRVERLTERTDERLIACGG